MTPPGADRTTPFVGRAKELEDLTTLWEHVRRGRATLAVVTGDAGIGKTRLATEFAAHAAAGGARVLWGNCVDLHEGGVTYAPFRQALRDVGHDPGLRATLDRLPAPLGDLLDRPPAADGRRARPGSLFETLHGVFHALAGTRPLLLVVEDIHWADHTTLDVLTYLAHNLGTVRMLSLLTTRPRLAQRNPAAERFLDGQASGAIARRIELGALDERAVAQQIAELTGAEPRPREVAEIAHRSGGNPLFIEELVSARAHGDGRLSPSLLQLLRARVRDLPGDVREVLEVAAVAGQTVAYDDLRAVIDRPRRTVGELLRRAVEAGVMVEDTDNAHYTFRQALVQEALYEDLPGDRRRELHRRFADVLVTRGRATTAAPGAIAIHWDHAGEPARALPAYLEAADAARETFGFVDARRFVQRAYELWDEVDRPEVLTGLTRRHVANRTIEHAIRTGDAVTVVEIAQGLVNAADRDADTRVMAFQRGQLAQALWFSGREDAAVREVVAAVEAIIDDEPSPEQARIFALWSGLLALNGRYIEAGALADRALDGARVSGSPRAYRYGILMAGSVAARLGDLKRGLELLGVADDLARRRNDADEIMRVVLHRGRLFQAYARWERARRVYLDGLAAAPMYGMSERYAWRFHVLAARMSYLLGRWHEAAEDLVQARSQVSGRGAALPSLLVATGHFEAAAAFYAQPRARWRTEGTGRVQVPEGPVELAGWQGRLDAARAATDAGLELVDGSEEAIPEARLCRAALRAEADAVERGATTEEEAEARAARLVDRLRRLHVTHPERGDGFGREVAALLAASAAEQQRASGRGDPDAWAQVAVNWDALAMPYPYAYARWQQARALRARGIDRARAADLRAEALAIAEALGAHPLQSAIRGVSPAVAVGERATLLDVLTDREREIAGLLVEGCTNRRIGSALGITEGTASVHVSRILRKLGATSRGQAIAMLLGDRSL